MYYLSANPANRTIGSSVRLIKMLASILAVVLTPAAYSFPIDKPALYEVNMKFDGFIPILGGQNGVVDVDLGVSALGLKNDADGHPQVATELRAIKVKFNGASMPLDINNAKTYFPKTTVSLTPQGRILKSDAPSMALPIRLPGLDIRRMPDVTFLPVEFPADGVEVGKEWSYKKSFGDSDVTFNLKATSVNDDKVEMDVKMAQSYDTLEDSALAIPSNPKDAVAKVHTDMTGEGKAVFDRKLGLIRSAVIDADAKSKSVNIESKASTDRELKSHLSINLASGGTIQAINNRPTDKIGQLKAQAAFYWEMAKIKAGPMLASARQFIERQLAFFQRLASDN